MNDYVFPELGLFGSMFTIGYFLYQLDRTTNQLKKYLIILGIALIVIFLFFDVSMLGEMVG